jgi:hypothetical protein
MLYFLIFKQMGWLIITFFKKLEGLEDAEIKKYRLREPD